MKMSEAVNHIRVLRRVAQRAQTIARETREASPEIAEAAAALQPWLFGPTSILDVAIRIEDMIDKGQELRPLDFYNVMTIEGRIEPMINMLRVFDDGESFPMQDSDWLRGWEPEEA